jgi:hypothetical protein
MVMDLIVEVLPGQRLAGRDGGLEECEENKRGRKTQEIAKEKGISKSTETGCHGNFQLLNSMTYNKSAAP